MHSYLVSAKTKDAQEKSIQKLVKKLGVVTREVKAGKIEEVRNLNFFIKLKLDSPTAIIIRDIESSTPEALNALLKNLEEPQEKLCFVLTTASLYKVLPTVTSRCQIIVATNQQIQTDEKIQKFLHMPTSHKLAYINGLRGREEAISFIEQIILYVHLLLHQKDPNYFLISEILRKAQAILFSLKANGNVTLQLTDFVVNYPS
jgi:DNA polymerase III delta prime subunit